MISEKFNVESVIINFVDKINAVGFTHVGDHSELTATLLEIETSSKLNVVPTFTFNKLYAKKQIVLPENG